MRRRLVISIPVALVLATAACASAEDAAPETTIFPFSGSALEVRSEEPTDVVATDRTDIKVVRWFSSRYATGIEQAMTLDGDVLVLRAGCTGLANCDARFRVEVPRGVRVHRNGEPAPPPSR